MKYLVVTLGSAGDLHPFLAVARALAAAGHDVEVMSNAPYEAQVRREGLEFTPLCTERDHRRTTEHPDLWHAMRGFGVLWRHLVVPAIEPVRARIAALCEEFSARGAPLAALRVLASPLAVGARVAREEFAFPLCSVYTAPANLRGVSDPMYVGAWRVPTWLPGALRRGVWWLVDRRKLEPLARPAIDAALRARGLQAPGASLFGVWIHSPDGGITLFPPSFGSAQPDWPEGVELGDFPCFRASNDDKLGAGLEHFLASGAPPVVVFPGSAPGASGGALMREALGACRALGLRVVALGPAAVEPRGGGREGVGSLANGGAIPGTKLSEDPEFVFRSEHAALELLLPRACVFVHHGGIGSCAQGLRARTPQLIRPFAYDQFDNAARIEQEGAGRLVERRAAPGVFLGLLDELARVGGAIGSTAAQDGEELHGLHAVMRALARWEHVQ